MKRFNQKGFTLAELLIVVAIIAVLVAISIPIFSSQLEKSKENTDIANLRAAKAAAVSAYLTEDSALGLNTFTKTNTHVVLVYDAVAGVLKPATAADTKIKALSVTGYGKGTATVGGCSDYEMRAGENGSYTTDSDVAGDVIVVDIDNGGTLAMGWVSASSETTIQPGAVPAASKFNFSA